MDTINKYHGPMLLKKPGDLYFLLDDFGVEIIPLKLEKLKKFPKGKNI